MLEKTHKKIMLIATEYLNLPEHLRRDLTDMAALPDKVDKGVNRILRHILIPLPVGHFGSALDRIKELMDFSDPTKNVAFISHYIVDLCSPFHTILYSIYRQGYHNMSEHYIDKMLDDWMGEYAPNPVDFTNLEKTILQLAKDSQQTAMELLLGFSKFELRLGEYPSEPMKKALFRALDYQIGFLQHVIDRNILPLYPSSE